MPSEQPPTRVHECPTCGSPVEVVSSDEGTHHYRPAPSEQPREGTRVEQTEAARAGHFTRGVPVTVQPQPRGEEARLADEWEILRSEISRYVEAAHKGDAVEPVTDLILTAFMDSPARNPAPARGEGDDLAARLEDWAKQVAWPDPVYTDDMARDLRDAAQLLARASTHPEQSERIVGAALDLLDSLGAPHYHDLIGMTYTLRKEQADNLRAALEPASPTPTEQGEGEAS